MNTRPAAGSTRGSVLSFVPKRLRSVPRDWGLLLALALGLFAATPFLARAGLPHQTDAELHVYRAAELGHVLQQGLLYPRWAPNLYLGYGYPIFNYYAPLTYYLGNLFALLLPAAGVVAGVKAVFVLGLALASLGAYLLGREFFDPAAGLLAAAAFTFCPYVLFIDPHARGDLAEHFAICLLPLTLTCFHRLARSPGRGTLLASAVSLAALVFSHNLLGLVASVLVLAYWVWSVAHTGSPRSTLWGLLTFALSAALIAFFWLPALLERDAVKLQVVGPGHFDFREHFLTFRELLAPSRLVDWGATGPRYRHNLGLPQVLLASLGGIGLLVGHRPTEKGGARSSTGFFVAAATALILLMLAPSTPVWEAVPGMAYMQFPWRLLGPANLMLALFAAAGLARLPRRPWRYPAMAGAMAMLLVLALPLLFPTPWSPHFGGTAPADIIAWEKRSQALGTTSTGDFLPVTVDIPPSPTRTLVQSYAGPGPVDKVNRATVPQGAHVDVLEHTPTHDRFQVVTPKGFRLRLYTFFFPGWRAYVDGTAVDIEVGRPEGFITLHVPEGEHTVLVRFEDTWPRRLGWLVAGLGLAALIAAVVLGPGGADRERPRESARLHPAAAAWLGGTIAAVVALRLAAPMVVGARPPLVYASPPGQALPAQHTLQADFEGQIELLGYDLPRARLRPGDSLSVVLYWRALTDVEENYQSFVHLARPLNVAWAQEDHLNPGGLPTRRWPLDRYVWDEYEIAVPYDLPPGEYDVNVGLYLRATGRRLQRQGAGDPDVADSIVVAVVEVLE